jgi:hypothetical protein
MSGTYLHTIVNSYHTIILLHGIVSIHGNVNNYLPENFNYWGIKMNDHGYPQNKYVPTLALDSAPRIQAAASISQKVLTDSWSIRYPLTFH